MTGQTPETAVRTREMRAEELNKTKILLIDELDCLITKDQSVLFNLFEWPQRRRANLIVLSVANTLDLPEMFMARISSRIGNTRLVFSPYSSLEIRDIILQRVAKAEIFDSVAINFIAKKVALISSDIRKTLNICRQAVERHRKQFAAQEGQLFDQKDKISMAMVSEIFEQSYSASPLIQFVKNSRELVRDFMTEMYYEMKLLGGKKALLTSVYKRYANSTKGLLFNIKAQEFVILSKLLVEKNIIELHHNKSSMQLEIHLQTNLDEIAYALKDDPFFNSKLM